MADPIRTQKFNFRQFLINLAVTAGLGFLGIYSQTGSVKAAGIAAGATAASNVAGLLQKQPQNPTA